MEREKKKDGTVVYDAEVKKGGKTVDIKVAEDGELIEIDEDDDNDDDND